MDIDYLLDAKRRCSNRMNMHLSSIVNNKITNIIGRFRRLIIRRYNVFSKSLKINNNLGRILERKRQAVLNKCDLGSILEHMHTPFAIRMMRANLFFDSDVHELFKG